MEPRRTRQSVMARLMGIYEVPRTQEPVRERKRVLSESYRRRVASIGVGRKRSFGSSQNVGPRASFEALTSSGSMKPESGCVHPKRNSLAFSIGLGAAMMAEDVVDTLRKSRRRREYLEPNRKNKNDTARCQTMTQNESLSGDKRIRMSSDSGMNKRTEFLNLVSQRVEVEQENRNIKGCDDGECIRPLEELGRRMRWRVTKGSSSEIRGSETYVTKPEVSKPTGNMDELFAKQDHVSTMRNHKLGVGRSSIHQARYTAFRKKWNLRSEKPINWERLKLTKQYSNWNKDGSEPKSMRLKSEPSDQYAGTSDDNGSENTRANREEMKNNFDKCQSIRSDKSVCEVPNMVSHTEIASKSPADELESKRLESQPSTLLEQDVDGSVQQLKNESIGFHEETCDFSCCPRMEVDSLVILEEAHDQQSPVSVLEPPFSEEYANDAEFLKRVNDDIHELELHSSETLDSSSEGPGMAVSDSSDEEGEKVLTSESIRENKASMEIRGVEESRNFSYLLQVIMLACLHGKNMVEFNTWHSLEFPISHSVFETLEKCSDEISWTRSDRRLLFDRINAGLVQILLPCIGVPTREKSVSRRFSIVGNESMIKEDLWKLLASQEKKRNKSSEENVLGSELGKIELGDEITEIGREMESLLFDELLAELLY